MRCVLRSVVNCGLPVKTLRENFELRDEARKRFPDDLTHGVVDPFTEGAVVTQSFMITVKAQTALVPVPSQPPYSVCEAVGCCLS